MQSATLIPQELIHFFLFGSKINAPPAILVVSTYKDFAATSEVNKHGVIVVLHAVSTHVSQSYILGLFLSLLSISWLPCIWQLKRVILR